MDHGLDEMIVDEMVVPIHAGIQYRPELNTLYYKDQPPDPMNHHITQVSISCSTFCSTYFSTLGKVYP